MPPTLLSSRRVLLEGRLQPATLELENGLISAIFDHDPSRAGDHHDYHDLVVMAGLIDTHVHINEPGRTDWEGFATATRAAAAGGLTTLVDMPLNSIPSTVDADSFRLKLEAAAGQLRVDVGFWGGAVVGNLDGMRELAQAGVLGFKCFLSPSGTDEFTNLDFEQLGQAMQMVAELDSVLLVHAEDPAELLAFSGDPRSYDNYLATRPPRAEVSAIERVVAGAKATGCRAHVVHLATEAGLASLAHSGVTVETCPHYLTFAAEEIADGATAYKCAPPIRGRATREALWQALERGAIQLVATDHSPSPAELKCIDSGDFSAAWGGISSLELLLPAVWTEAARRGHGVEKLARWVCSAPARLAGLDHLKGRLEPGLQADLVVWDPNASFVVDRLEHRHALTPYQGRTLRGVVEATYLRGQRIFFQSQHHSECLGQILKKARTKP
ncbi:MAG: allantoinase AllB [Candidatus Eremiobacteraeota bacterium]|nr:allantoinase AllB [Candidatus Eremiobacteraeota bacterium]